MFGKSIKKDFFVFVTEVASFIKKHVTFLIVFAVILAVFYFALTRASAFDLGADFAIGQSDTSSSAPNAGGLVSADGYNTPSGVASDGTHVFVSDCNNNRVLIYNSIPATSGVPADVVIGQADMLTGDGVVASSSSVYCPEFLATNGTKLIIADFVNNRVLIYNTVPTSDGQPADVVIGQSNMSSSLANQGGSPGANTLNGPVGVNYDSGSGKLFISDYYNHRVLIYNSIPVSDNASADVVIGQPNMGSNSSNQGGSPAANTLNSPYNARVIENKLIIVDNSNHRVLIYNSIPVSDNASADVVIGQPNMGSNSSNQGGSPAANTLNSPTDILWEGTNFLVQDSGNNRILIFNALPASDDASADDAIGQTDLTSSSSSSSPTGLNTPGGQMNLAGSVILIGDAGNNRVLGYNDLIPASPTPTLTPAPTPIPDPGTYESNANTDTYRGGSAVYALLNVGDILYLGGDFGLEAIDIATGDQITWTTGINSNVRSLAYANDTLFAGTTDGTVLAFDTATGTGTLKWDFVSPDFLYQGVSGRVYALSIIDDVLYAGGQFDNIGVSPRSNLASFDISSSSPSLTSWTPDPSDKVLALKYTNSKLYVGGWFNTIDSASHSALVAFNPLTTDLDNTFDPGFGTSSIVSALEYYNNKIYAGGSFTTVDGSTFDNLVRVDQDSGAPDTSWTPSLIYDVYALAQKNGYIYVGEQGEDGGSVVGSAVSYNLQTGSLADWDPEDDQPINAMLTTDNALYVGLIEIYTQNTFNFKSKSIFDRISHLFVPVAKASKKILADIGGLIGTIYLAQFDIIPTPTSTPTTGAGATNTPTPGPGSPPVCTDSKPGNPSNVTAVAGPNSDQITLSWTAAPSPVTDYSITYSDDPTTQKYGVVSTGNVTTYVISNLNPGTTYYFWVNAINGCKPGDQIGPATPGGGPVSNISTPSGSLSNILQNSAVNPLPATGPLDLVKIGGFGALLLLIGAVLLFAL